MELLVVDDGVGFDQESLKKGRSLGLLGMQERAMAIGGVLSVEEREGGGTVVRLHLPPS